MSEPFEVLFYQLDRQSLEQVLPMLVEKTLGRGWRAVIQSGSAERLESLDTALWTFRDDSFLAHGTKSDGHDKDQPIYLTIEDDNPNAAGVRFLVDGATMTSYEGYVRVVYMFDGRDKDAIEQAREAWRAAKDAGCTATYWQQDENGGWKKKA